MRKLLVGRANLLHPRLYYLICLKRHRIKCKLLPVKSIHLYRMYNCVLLMRFAYLARFVGECAPIASKSKVMVYRTNICLPENVINHHLNLIAFCFYSNCNISIKLVVLRWNFIENCMQNIVWRHFKPENRKGNLNQKWVRFYSQIGNN